MKIAIVHELLTMRGGAEHVALLLAQQFPQADIFTLCYNKKLFKNELQNRNVRSATTANIVSKFIPAHHLLAPLFSHIVRKWDFSDYDVVISSSSSLAHQITIPAHIKHICYVHSPARYLWDRTHDVRTGVQKRFLGRLQTIYFNWLTHWLRQKDALVDHSNTTLLAASAEVQRRIELYWRQPSTVVYPPISTNWFQTEYTTPPTRDYYLVVSTLVPYKQIELAITACNTLQLPLKIAGTGPDLNRLQNLAGPTIEFLGHTKADVLAKLYYNAKAVLFPGNEDFGLVPLEAMSQGTPVIGQAIGGALETIRPGKNGYLFAEPTAESLAHTLQTVDVSTIKPEVCKAAAANFTKETFIAAIRKELKNS